MESVGEGIMVLDAAARVQVANPAAAAIFGRDVAAMAGRHVDELLVPQGELPAAPAPGARVEMVGIRGDGEPFPGGGVDGRAVPLERRPDRHRARRDPAEGGPRADAAPGHP